MLNFLTATVDDASANRKIRVEKGGSATTVIWNPWDIKAASMTDFGREEWRRMFCVETANTSADAVTLQPRARHAMRAAITPG